MIYLLAQNITFFIPMVKKLNKISYIIFIFKKQATQPLQHAFFSSNKKHHEPINYFTWFKYFKYPNI